MASATPLAADNRAHLELVGLTKRYGAGPAVVEDLNLAIAKGELVALLGPSGCGKTTSLRMIAGLVPPSSGAVHVAGQDITRLPPYRRNMGLVFQSYALFPHLSVADNVAFGLEMRGLGREETRKRVEGGLAEIEIDGGTVKAATSLGVGRTVTVMVRPHRIRLEAASERGDGEPWNRLPGRLAKTIYVGDIVQYKVLCGATTVLAERGTAGPGWSERRPDESVSLAWDVADTLVFEASEASR